MIVTIALLPALFPGQRDERPTTVRAAAAATVPVFARVPGTTTSTLAPPTPTTATAPRTTPAAAHATTPTTVRRVAPAHRAPAVTTTTAPRPRPRPTTTTTARPTTTTTARPTTTTTARPNAGRTESGKASWYDYEPGICAHKTLPFGTVVTVTNVANGRSVNCTVGDRGPFVEGWVIDLNPREFERLAPRSAGVISVRLTW